MKRSPEALLDESVATTVQYSTYILSVNGEECTYSPKVLLLYIKPESEQTLQYNNNNKNKGQGRGPHCWKSFGGFRCTLYSICKALCYVKLRQEEGNGR